MFNLAESKHSQVCHSQSPLLASDTQQLTAQASATTMINHHDPNHEHHAEDCRSYAPRDELGSWSRVFDVSIVLTAALTFVLNMFVVVILVTNYKALRRRTARAGHCSAAASEQLTMSNTHLSFISLSASVILYSSLCVPALYFHTIDDDHQNRNSWLLFMFLKFLFCSSPIASSFVNLFMCFDRYLAIENLMRPKQFWYKRHYSACLTLLWLFSVLLVVPLIWYDRYTHEMRVILTISRLVASFTVPSILELILYARIACILVHWSRDNPGFESSLEQNRAVAVKLLVLALTHFVCWFPFSVVESLNDLFPDLFHRCDSDVHKHIYYRTLALLILLTSLSGVAYPILYCFVSKQFQKILRRQCRRLFASRSGKQRAVKHSASDRTNTTELVAIKPV